MMNKDETSQQNRTSKLDMRPEYDFSGGVRGKHAQTLREHGYIICVYHEDGSYNEKQMPAKTAKGEQDGLE